MMLEVQICTLGNQGLARVAEMKLPVVENVRYLVSVQNPEADKLNLPSALQRQDIEIFEHRDRGLSNNRNAAIAHSSADIILIADDDLDYTVDGLNFVKSVFEADALLDFATFKHSGDDNKIFPDHSFRIGIKLPKGYYLTSFELAFRRTSLPQDIGFSPMLGIGSPHFAVGEENVFMYRLTLAGLRGRFFPHGVAFHKGITSGCRQETMLSLQGYGAWCWIRYGYVEGFVRALRNAPRRKATPGFALKYILKGFFMAPNFFDSKARDFHDK